MNVLLKIVEWISLFIIVIISYDIDSIFQNKFIHY